MSDARAQHRAVSARPASPVPDSARPTPGPITLLPEPGGADVVSGPGAQSLQLLRHDAIGPDRVRFTEFADAVRSGGGVVVPLSDETRGLVWLASGNPADLVAALRRHPTIEWVQLPWAGVDSFSDVLATFAGLDHPLWTSAKGAYAQPVAEHALALVLALLRVLPSRIAATGWSWVPEGRSLYGLEVVVVGAGGIAVELLRLLEPFGTRVTVVRRRQEPMEGADLTVTVDRLLEVLPAADVVVLAAALTGESTGLFGEAELAAMRSDAVLVNVARGGLVDTDALTSALASGRIAGAGVDVTDPEPLPDGHPLWREPRIIVTPHSADTPDMTAPLLAERIRANTLAFLGDGRFVGVVDVTAGY